MQSSFIVIVIIGIILVLALVSMAGDSLSDLRESSSFIESTPTAQQNDSDPTETVSVNTSTFTNQITLHTGGAKKDEPQDEYIEIRADDDNISSVNITGWTLESLESGRKITIGNVTSIPLPHEFNTANSNVILEPGHEAYIITGGSPVRASFQINKCTGYFEENNTFIPRLPKECPDPEDERLEDFGIDSDPPNNSNDEDCIRALKSISQCTNPGKPDEDLSNDCRDYINDIGYELCAQLHVGDHDFFGDEWYVYIDYSFWQDLWDDDDETIELRDSTGKLVDVIEY